MSLSCSFEEGRFALRWEAEGQWLTGSFDREARTYKWTGNLTKGAALWDDIERIVLDGETLRVVLKEELGGTQVDYPGLTTACRDHLVVFFHRRYVPDIDELVPSDMP